MNIFLYSFDMKWRVVSDSFENKLINIGNLQKYFTESCSEGPNNQLLLNLSINETSPWLDEHIQEKLTYYEMG